MAELAEGARLLSECGGKLPPRVRIPVSPPPKLIKARDSGSNAYEVLEQHAFSFHIDQSYLSTLREAINSRPLAVIGPLP